MKMPTRGYSFLILTLIAGLDLLAAVVTSVPDGIIGGVLVACLVLMMVTEVSAAGNPLPEGRDLAAPAAPGSDLAPHE